MQVMGRFQLHLGPERSLTSKVQSPTLERWSVEEKEEDYSERKA